MRTSAVRKEQIILLISVLISILILYVGTQNAKAVIVGDSDNCPVTGNCNAVNAGPDVGSGYCIDGWLPDPNICEEACGCDIGTCDPGTCPYFEAEWSCYNVIYTGMCVLPDTGNCGAYLCGGTGGPPNVGCSKTGGGSCERVDGGGGGGLTATCSPSSQSSGAGQILNFTGSASGGDSPYAYSWSAPGSSNPSDSGTNFSTSYPDSSSHTVTLTVTDNDSNTDTAQCAVNGGGGGGSSIVISGYDAKIAKASTPPLADSYSGPPASNVDVSMNLTIVSGCGVDQCDLTYWFYCNAGGPLTDAFYWDPLVFGGLSDGDTAPRYFTDELCNYTTPGASYTAEGIVRVSRSGYTDAVASDTMPVSIAGTAPTVNLSAAPTAVTLGNSSNLTWTTTDATACSAGAAPSNTNWTGPKVVNGSQSTGALNQNTTFFLTCTGPGGSAQDQVTVTVDGPSPDVSVAITAVNSSGSFSLKDVKDGDILTFEIVYRNSGTGTATNVHNVEINLSNNHSYESGYVCPSCAGPPPDPQQMTFNRNVPLLPGASFTVSFNSRVNTSSNTQPFEILTVNTNGIFNPGALPFDTTYALLAAPNRPPSPGFEEVAP